MKKMLVLVGMLSLSGCLGAGGPSKSDIRDAYQVFMDKAAWGGPRILEVREITWSECKELKETIGWVCSFRATFDKSEPLEDIGTFTKESQGWKFMPQ